MAAMIIEDVNKYDRITPVLKKLHIYILLKLVTIVFCQFSKN